MILKVKKKNSTDYICHKSGNMLDITLPGPPGTGVYQDHYGGHCKKKKSRPCNDAMKIQTPKSR
jgi:hypothetical protein